LLSEKNLLPPYGVCGGRSGAPNAPHPAGPAGVVHYHCSQQLAIPKYSKNVEAAKDFLRWLMDENQLTTISAEPRPHVGVTAVAAASAKGASATMP
jgi:ABC-type glycerol-3-phosphate transport system substrate-binding protein